MKKVGASIRAYGFRQPVVVDRDEVIIIGHLRRAAARKEGFAEIPVHVANDLTPAQVRGLRLMDNRSHEEADWDFDLLGTELKELRALDFDLNLTGFDDREIDDFLSDPDLDDRANNVPELPAHAVTVPGDLWICGKHRVLCGDSTVSEAVSRACGRTKPFLMATDPPYGVSYSPEWRIEHDGGGRHALGKVANDDQVDWTAALKLFVGDVAYVWHAGVHAGEVAESLHTIGFQIRAQIIWSKQHFVFGRGNYHWGHEPCWYAVRKGKQSNWCGDRTQSTVWEVKNLNPHGGNKDEKQTGHSTQKPVELMRRPILNHTKRGGAVYDPFLGSGTTLIAAEMTGRACCGIEIDPKYCDVICQRFMDFSGKQATLESDGRTFEQVKAERVGLAA